VKRTEDCSLYLVISEEYCWGNSVIDIAKKAIEGGVDIIQMREKNKSIPELVELGKKFSNLCRREDVIFIVNDDPYIAKEVDADGVHLGQEDIKKYPIGQARRILGKKGIIGMSTHSIETFEEACASDVDYIAYGPVFPTSIKSNCVGTEDVGRIVAMAKKPVFFIGGINLSNVGSIIEKGARNISLIRAITEAHDVASVARNFRKELNDAKERVYK
jgi:thiamine-phosphate pyrophosphorylase